MDFVFWILFVYLIFCIIRVIKGPSAWDRLLGLALVSNKIILISLLVASFYNLAYLMDFIIVYALLGFVGIVFIALYLLKKRKEREG